MPVMSVMRAMSVMRDMSVMRAISVMPAMSVMPVVRANFPYLINGAPVHPFVWVFSVLLGVEVEHGQRRVELLRSRIVQGTLL